jgi:hypothetical protein
VREAVIQKHKAHVFLLNHVKFVKEPNETYATKQAELSAYQAELRGLAFAIGDQELLDLVNHSERHSDSMGALSEEEQFQSNEHEVPFV